jgi:hypothetical protein
VSDTEDIITINGAEYPYVELEDAQQYMVNQIRSLNAKILKARFELEQIKIAHEAFSSQLIQSVKETEPEKVSE